MRTYLQLTQQNRRLGKLNAEAAAAISEMRRHGLTLQLEYHNGSPRWHLSNGKRVERDVAQHMISGGGLVADGDALFHEAKNQTYRVRTALNQVKDLRI